MDVPAIEIRGLKKAFGKHAVLQGVDLTIRRCEITVIMGLSGSGKSVLLKNVIGLIQPDAGEVLIDGTSFYAASRRQRRGLLAKMAMCFQNSALFDSMTAWDNVAFPLREQHRTAEPEIAERVNRALSLVGLADLDPKKYPAELSGGMRKRIGLARALVMEPEIILFDEPTTGLDPILSDKVTDTIRRTHAAVGYTCIIVTHDLKVTFGIGHHVALLLGGRIAFDGTPGAFKASPDPAVQQFIAGNSSEGPIQVQ